MKKLVDNDSYVRNIDEENLCNKLISSELNQLGEFLPSNNERIIRHSLIERAHLLSLILSKV